MTENKALKDDLVSSQNDHIEKKKRGGGVRTRTEVLMAGTPLQNACDPYNSFVLIMPVKMKTAAHGLTRVDCE